jgi:hypothetical protein
MDVMAPASVPGWQETQEGRKVKAVAMRPLDNICIGALPRSRHETR